MSLSKEDAMQPSIEDENKILQMLASIKKKIVSIVGCSLMTKKKRQDARSRQIKQIHMDMLRLLVTTRTHGAQIFISPSFRVHKMATAWDFNTFLQMYASALKAQRKLNRRDVKYNITHVWERFNERGGLSQMQALCLALLNEGCDEELVDEAMDAYHAALISHEDTRHVRSSLGRHLNGALRGFIAECNMI